MSGYNVRLYKGNYKKRQQDANKDGCICYIEHHFNSSFNPEPSYVVVVLGSNASDASKKMGKMYSERISRVFGNKVAGDDGILIGGYQGRGNYNLKFTNMPAILLEPLFGSNPEQAELIRSEHGQRQLASVLVGVVKECFPEGGLVGVSVGHKYKTSKPFDRGAKIYGGGTEAYYAEIVLRKFGELLKSGVPDSVMEEAATVVKVILNDELAFEKKMKTIKKLAWNETQNKLYIYGDEA